VKRTILTVSVCLALVPHVANATDWALNSTLSNTVELNSNPFLATIPAGTFSSFSTINVNAVALTPTSKFTFDGDESYRKYWGPGIDGAPSESISSDVKAHYETFGKDPTDRNYVNGSLTSQSTAFALLGQLGLLTNARGYLETSHVDGGIDRSITKLDFVSLQGGTTYTAYDPGNGGTPFTDSTVTASWRHRWDSVLTLTASSNVETLDFANALQSKATIFRENAGFEATLSPVLSFRGTAGVAYIQTVNGSAAISLGSSASSPGGSSASGSATAPIYDLLLTYKMFPDTTWTLAGVQAIAPSLVGSLIESTTASVGLTHIVNSRETLSFAASASSVTSAGTESDILSGSATLSYALTREWNAQLSYRYLHRLASPGTASATFDPLTGLPILTGLGPATSNSITLVVSRSFTLLPNGY
jgi:hypothetical protein